MPNTTHRFHIELEGIDPPVWRCIRVPSSYSFWDLHVAIQDAMGWLDLPGVTLRPQRFVRLP
jgi:hypothetical protein